MGRLATDIPSAIAPALRTLAAEGGELTPGQLRAARSASSLRRRPRSKWTDWRWTDRHRRLAAHPLLAACPRSEIRTLVRYGEEVEVDAGMPLLREDSIGKWFVLVLEGNLALSRRGEPVGMLGPGSWVGDTAILGFGPQPATVTAASPCVLFVLGPRPVLSFAIDLAGLRDALFPGCTHGEALDRARTMRLEGRAAWDLLRPEALAPNDEHRFDHPPAPLPRAEASGRSLALAAQPFLPATGSAAPTFGAPRSRPVPAAVRWGAVAAAAAVLLAVVTLVHVPYYSVEGHARSAAELVSVTDVPSHPPVGHLLLLSVDVHHDTPLDMLRGWLDPDVEIRSTGEVYGDQDPAELQRANLELMDRSKSTAAAIALRTVAGDARTGIRIDSKGLGGPSAGLGLALSIVDLLTAGELTAGQRVAVTGSMDATGRVGSVGGITYKVRAARDAGADLLLVPTGNHRQAAAAAGDLEVVAVDSFQQAIDVLVARGGVGP